MSSFDFERVEQELIQHVNPANISNNNTRSLQNTSGWTSGGIGKNNKNISVLLLFFVYIFLDIFFSQIQKKKKKVAIIYI